MDSRGAKKADFEEKLAVVKERLARQIWEAKGGKGSKGGLQGGVQGVGAVHDDRRRVPRRGRVGQTSPARAVRVGRASERCVVSLGDDPSRRARRVSVRDERQPSSPALSSAASSLRHCLGAKQREISLENASLPKIAAAHTDNVTSQHLARRIRTPSVG